MVSLRVCHSSLSALNLLNQNLVVTIYTGVKLVGRYKNSLAYVGIIYFIPNIVGSILVNTLPWKDKVGLLFSVWITGVGELFNPFQYS